MKKATTLKHWTFSAGQLSSDRYEEIKKQPYNEQIAELDSIADTPHSETSSSNDDDEAPQ